MEDAEANEPIDTSLVMSLVRAHLLQCPDYLSWVTAYTTIRWSKNHAYALSVAGHYRRKALYARLLAAVNGTCRLQELVYPLDVTRVRPPPYVFKRRRTKEGDIIPLSQRQLEWG